MLFLSIVMIKVLSILLPFIDLPSCLGMVIVLEKREKKNSTTKNLFGMLSNLWISFLEKSVNSDVFFTLKSILSIDFIVSIHCCHFLYWLITDFHPSFKSKMQPSTDVSKPR